MDASAPPRGRRRTGRLRRLEALYERYHRPELLGSDPLIIVHRYADVADREIVGLIAACLAYGNVKAILRGVADVLARLGDAPRASLCDTPDAVIRRDFRTFRYRVTDGEKMAGLLVAMKRVIERHGSLHDAFLAHQHEAHETIVDALAGWVDAFQAAADTPLDHLLAHPARQSACKRLLLFLRWMVRRDAIDPGGWDGVCPSRLVVPLDVHMHRMARRLRLTQRKQPTLTAALEVTRRFRRYAPLDPLRYDFALTRPGILREIV